MYYSWESVKEFQTPTPVYAASYLPDRNIFVCGGEDFKMYKYEYSSGEELGMSSCHIQEYEYMTVQSTVCSAMRSHCCNACSNRYPQIRYHIQHDKILVS